MKPDHARDAEEDVLEGSPRQTIWRARGVKVSPERVENVRDEGHVCVLPPGVDAFRGAPIEHTPNACFLLVKMGKRGKTTTPKPRLEVRDLFATRLPTVDGADKVRGHPQIRDGDDGEERRAR